MIFIRLTAIRFRCELVTRNPGHGVEHAFVGNAAGAQLGIDHALAQDGESGGLVRRSHTADRESGPENTLFSPVAHAHVEADYAVLIAVAHDRDIAVNVVFALNDLLRTLRDIRAVGESYVIGELLFNGDLRTARRGVGFRGQALRIDLDAANAEEFLHAAADGGVDGLVDDQVRGFVAKHGLPGLLLELFRFFAGAAKSEQRDDVRLGQRRFGAIVHVEAIRRAGDRYVEIVVANVRGRLQVDLRFDCNWVREGNVATLEAKLDAVEVCVPFEDVGATENAGPRDRTAQAQIGVTRQPSHGGLHLEFGRGADGYIHLHVVERRIGGRERGRLAAAFEI